MFASAAVMVLAMTQLPPPIVIPQTQLHVTWNQSPNGAGRTTMMYSPTDVPVARIDYWQAVHSQTDAYLLLGNTASQPWLILNTRNGVIETGRDQVPGAPGYRGFTLTNSSATPFMLEFTCPDALTAQGWRNNGNPLVITITP